MRKQGMPDVVQKRRHAEFVEIRLGKQALQATLTGRACQRRNHVADAKAVFEAGVICRGIDEVAEASLVDEVKPLDHGTVEKGNLPRRKGLIAMHRVADYLVFGGRISANLIDVRGKGVFGPRVD